MHGDSLDDAQHSVEFLCQKFSALFANLQREEHLRAEAEQRNQTLELQIMEAERDAASQFGALRSQIDSRQSEITHLRDQADTADLRAGEGNKQSQAFVAMAAVAEKRCGALQDALQEESRREKDLNASLRTKNEELSVLWRRRTELGIELEGAQAGQRRALEELDLAKQRTAKLTDTVMSLERKLEEEGHRREMVERAEWQSREELEGLEIKVSRVQARLEELRHALDNVREEAQQRGETCGSLETRREQTEEELRTATEKLKAARQEGYSRRVQYEQAQRETERLKDQLTVEQRLRAQEAESLQVAKSTLALKRDELSQTEVRLSAARQEAERLQQMVAASEATCGQQSKRKQELQHARGAGEVALGSLRAELRALTAERSKLQEELDTISRERSELKLEVKAAQPALADARRRCLELEERLRLRTKELDDELSRRGQCLREVSCARDRAEQLQRRADDLSSRARELNQQSLQRVSPTAVPSRPPSHSTPPFSKPPLASDPVPVQKPGYPMTGIFSPSTATSRPPVAQNAHEAVRYLCDFIAKEEERLGIGSNIASPSVSAPTFPGSFSSSPAKKSAVSPVT